IIVKKGMTNKGRKPRRLSGCTGRKQEPATSRGGGPASDGRGNSRCRAHQNRYDRRDRFRLPARPPRPPPPGRRRGPPPGARPLTPRAETAVSRPPSVAGADAETTETELIRAHTFRFEERNAPKPEGPTGAYDIPRNGAGGSTRTSRSPPAGTDQSLSFCGVD